MSSPSPEKLRRTFDLEHLDIDSLTPWSSVHRGRTRDGAQVVIKRTASSQDRAHAMADWTRALADAGVRTVTPADITVANPRPVARPDQPGQGYDDAAEPRQDQPERIGPDGEERPDWWVAYPFVPGRAYSGSAGDIEAAGDLLGRIHAVDLPPALRRAMRPYAWPETHRHEVDEDLQTLADVLRRHGGNRAGQAIATVGALAERWWSTAFPQLHAEDTADQLPRAGVPGDYKASNLVFIEERERGPSEPVLVDPDNGGIEPRIFDLALAVVLFHNECPGAPGRLLTPTEWHRFASAYTRHVDLTDRERALWPLALDHMLWEEGTWVLEDNDDAAWADPRQGAHLLDLALTTPDRYRLPPSPRGGTAPRT